VSDITPFLENKMPSNIFKAPAQTQIDYFKVQTGVSSTSSLNEMIINRFSTLLGLTSDTSLTLLIRFDGTDAATTYTAETGQTITFVGQAQLDTAQTKFGVSSLLLDGTGDYITVPDNANWNFGTGDFTIEMHVRFNAHTSHAGLYSQYVDANNYIIFYWDTVTGLNFLHKATSVIASYQTAWTPSNATWYHLALVRQGANIYFWVDGTLQTTTITTAITAATSFPDLAAAIRIGDYGDASTAMFNGWIDEVLILKGRAKYTASSLPANFTPRTATYPLTDTTPGTASDLVELRLKNLGYSGPLADMLNDFFRVKSGTTDRMRAEQIFFSNTGNNFT
jgi:hypothetical protein